VLKAINNLKFEVHWQGAPSQVGCPVEFDEFLSFLNVVYDQEDKNVEILTLHWQLLVGIDDMVILKVDRVGPKINHLQTARVVQEHHGRESAEQIIHGYNEL
jgi:hypothetical protein